MSDEVIELASFFPSKTHDTATDQYIAHHLNSIDRCIKNKLYSSAYSHLHLLYMTYIYIQLLRISTDMEKEFTFCWIGFPSQEKEFLTKPKSPFSFSEVNERTVFRFFRLIEFDDATIGDIARPIDMRNTRLHAKGDLFCDTEEEFSVELTAYVSRMKKVENKQFNYLNKIYKGVIESFQDPETRTFDYSPTLDDIESNLIEQYLTSSHQLTKLAHNRTDPLSIFIRDNY